jgi:DNA primase
MIIPLEIVTDFIYEHCDKVKITKGGTHFNARCPLCGDSKKNPSKRRFHLDWNNGNPGYHCFNCGRHGHFLELYAILEGLDSAEDAEKKLRNFKDLRNIINPKPIKRPTKEQSKNYLDLNLDDCISIKDNPQGYIQKAYWNALSKFIHDRDMGDYPLYVSYRGKYKGRIIIPIYENDTIVYFQARRISDDVEPKYLNPPVEKENIILNREKFDRNKYIIVTEGILDAKRVGDQGTPILGIDVSRSTIETLSKLTDKGIIICLDNDKPGKERLEKILKENFSKTLFFFRMPNKYKQVKDIDKLYMDHNIEDIYQFIVDNSFTHFNIQLNLRMENKL